MVVAEEIEIIFSLKMVVRITVDNKLDTLKFKEKCLYTHI